MSDTSPAGVAPGSTRDGSPASASGTPGGPASGSSTPGSGGPGSGGLGGGGRGGGAVRARLRRYRVPLIVAAVVVVAAVVGALAAGRQEGSALDPRNPSPEGSRAVAEILRGQGVDVQRVTLSTQVVEAVGTGEDATVLVTDPTLLGPDQLDRLAGTGADVVLVTPDALTLRTLAPALRAAGSTDPANADPSCDGPDTAIPDRAGSVSAGGHLFAKVAGQDDPTTICYPEPGAGTESGGSWATSVSGGRRVTAIGRPAVLTNEALAQQGNASLVLATLGAHDHLVWYQPDPFEIGQGDAAPSLRDLLPKWVPWVLGQLGIAVLLALLWRGRRLGRLVREPLPVVVRAAETQEGRARLYRRARARDRAAATLRTAALRRLAARLDLPPGAGPADLARTVALRLDRPEPVVAAVLLGPVPPDDEALVRLAADLDDLETALTTPSPTRP